MLSEPAIQVPHPLTACLPPEVQEAVSNGVVLKHDVVHVSVFLREEQQYFGFVVFLYVDPMHELRFLWVFGQETEALVFPMVRPARCMVAHCYRCVGVCMQVAE